MIRVKLMTEDAYCRFQSDYKNIYKMIASDNGKNDWIYSFDYDLFEDTEYEVEDPNLFKPTKNNKHEFENGIKLYNAFHELPRDIICSHLFWGWAILEFAYLQGKASIPLKESIIQTRWFQGNSRRAILLNALARLYFKVEMSIVNDGDNYRYTKFIFDNHSIYKNLVMRNIGMIHSVAINSIKLAMEYSKITGKIPDDTIASAIILSASKITSLKLIDIIPEDALYNEMKENLKNIIMNKPDYYPNAILFGSNL